MDYQHKTRGRELALQFLYQSEIERIYYFSDAHFNFLVEYFEAEALTKRVAYELCQGVYKHLQEIDTLVNQCSKNWSIQRMATTDRCILRISAYELIATDLSKKVIINEAVELAKTYGTNDSGRFVNGLLDQLSRVVRTT